MEASSFRVTEFAIARAQELTLLREQVKSLGGKKQLFQSLPWHLRRRTMSHYNCRLPKKWKTKTQNIDNRPRIGKNKCRKYRRKVKYLRENLKQRLLRRDRLETHLWFVKRFHMTNYFGYQVPWCSVDRKERSAYRAVRDRVVIYDASFVDWILLEEKQKEILDGLKKILKREQDKNFLEEPQFLSGKAVLHTFVEEEGMDNNNPEATILQVFFAPRNVLCNDDVCKVLICVKFLGRHEARDSFIQSIFGKMTATRPLVMNRFHALGPKSFDMIRRCFQINQEDWTNWKGEENRLTTGMENDVDTLGTCLNRMSILICDIPKGFHMGFPHFCSSSQLETNPSTDWLEEFQNYTEISISTVANKSYRIPIILFPRPFVTSNGKSLGKWDILIPSGFGPSFLHAARHMGAQAIGLKEYRRIFFECEKLHFPEDFPQSSLYRDVTVMNTCENLEKLLKKPPAKRGTNLFPFSVFPTLWNQLGKTPVELASIWDSMKGILLQVAKQCNDDKAVSLMQHLKACSHWYEDVIWKEPILTDTSSKALVPVFVKLIGKGNVSDNSPLFLPGEQDHSLFDTFHFNLSQVKERKLVGYVTETSYSFANGSFCAIGYSCCVPQLRNEWQPIIIPRTAKFTEFIPAKCRRVNNLLFDF